MSKNGENFAGFLRALGFTPAACLVVATLILVFGVSLGVMMKSGSRSSLAVKKTEVAPAVSEVASILSAPEEVVRDVSAFEEFSLPAPYDVKPPMVAFIIDDMGVDMIRSAQVLAFSAPLDVSYLTYAPNLQAQIDGAREAGKEVMLHVPMEAMSDTYDYGPAYLATSNSAAENVALLKKMIGGTRGFIGINNHMGSKFTADAGQMEALMAELDRLGLAFVDSLTSPRTKTRKIAAGLGMPYAVRDVFIDDSAEPSDILAQFALLESIAKKRGYAVAIGHPRTNTIRLLRDWLASAGERGFTVVPLSYIINNFERRK
ncbi:MAG: divergent polysaccharide deacetylase family protein [Rickettsiales bacterium]|jgi:polysaccharide deacetylase 2 family uncharacterized protein YibQ|nr:divergent polysaccharide deacetylase family protein [Rickettsiales bacterium]